MGCHRIIENARQKGDSFITGVEINKSTSMCPNRREDNDALVQKMSKECQKYFLHGDRLVPCSDLYWLCYQLMLAWSCLERLEPLATLTYPNISRCHVLPHATSQVQAAKFLHVHHLQAPPCPWLISQRQTSDNHSIPTGPLQATRHACVPSCGHSLLGKFTGIFDSLTCNKTGACDIQKSYNAHLLTQTL